MKPIKIHRIFRALPLAALVLACAGNALADAPIPAREIDWSAFLAGHDLKWEAAPKSHGESAFLGNGMLGATIWSARDEALHWDLGRCDLYDTGRSTRNRMPLGKLIMKLKGEPKSFSMRQSLFRAEATGSISTDAGAVEWRSIIPHDRMVGLIEYTTRGGESVQFDFFQLPPVNFNTLRKGLTAFIEDKPIPRKAKRVRDFSDPVYQPFFKQMARDKRYKRLFQYPEKTEGTEDQVSFLAQPFVNSGGYVVAWADRVGADGKHLLVWTVDFFPTGTPDPSRALGGIKKALAKGYGAAAKRNAAWWAEFYRKSFVSIPDPTVEQYYWLQIYKMGAATREDGVVLDQIGPWPRATGWARVWCNINIEIAYHSMMTCNHLELYAPFLRLFDDNREKFKRAVPEKYRSPGAMAVGRTMDIYGNTGWHWEFGDLAWIAHNYWMYCRYTGDEARLKKQFYPLVKGAATFMMNALEKDGNGIYHFPPDVSPEYPVDKAPDTNYNLALLRWSLRTLQFMNRHYGLHDPDKARWDEVQAHLAPFPVDKNGLMVAAGVPFTESHRHYSHLLAFYPLRVLDPDDPKDYALCKKSYDHWLAAAGPGPRRKAWNSFSYFGAAPMAAWLYDGDAAIQHLRDGAASATPSTFFGGPGPAVESVLAGTIGLGEMLLQSATSDPAAFRLRIFPAIPKDWKQARFEHLRAQGAFDVSAELRGGKPAWVRITSLAGAPCHVEAPFPGKPAAAGKRKFTVMEKTDRNKHRYFEIDIKKGETVTLTPVE